MITAPKKKFLPPDSQFKSKDKNLPFTICDFWQWAFSDLQLNNIRGIFSEFIIAKALSIPLAARSTWDDYDLVTKDNIKIEVKSGGYLQSWQQENLSKIVFTGLCGQAWDSEAGNRGGERQYRADIYVFAVQTAKTHKEFDPMQIDQWEFYLLPSAVLKKRKTKSITLNKVQELANQVSFHELKRELKKIMA